jgi:hypothetical protein
MLVDFLLKWATSRRGLARTRRPPSCRPGLEVLEDRFAPAVLTTVMSGLDNPRGLAFGPEGGLYVAEAGRGGDGPSIELRPGVFAYYGPSGAVSRLWQGQQERVATGLPSLLGPDGANGPQDISFQGLGNGFVTIGLGTDPTRRAELGEAGAGFARLVRLEPSGNWQPVADIGGNEAAVNPGGGPIDSNPFGLLAEPGGQVVVDAGGNVLLRVAANGEVATLAEFPSRDDGRLTDAVPTGITQGPDGAYYVGELTGVPFAAGAANVYRVVPGQTPEVVHTGFKTIIDLDFGPDGSLYVLQHATGPFLSGSGALIRIAPDGTRTILADEGLNQPTSVLVGDDGAIYVSNRGTSVGTGEVVRITPTPFTLAGLGFEDDSQQSMPATSPGVPGRGALAGEDGTSPTTLKLRPGSETVDQATALSLSSEQDRAEVGLADLADLVFLDGWPGEDDFLAPPVG